MIRYFKNKRNAVQKITIFDKDGSDYFIRVNPFGKTELDIPSGAKLGCVDTNSAI